MGFMACGMSNLSRLPRLFADAPLAAGKTVTPDRGQCHYLMNVLRLKEGGRARLFNGRDGEWLCEVTKASRKGCALVCVEPLKALPPPPDIDYVFAPLKHARLDYMTQKATELGARRLRPVFTEFTVPRRVNLERMRANAIEAAEQCNIVHVPEVLEPVRFETLLAEWEPGRAIIHCDEAAPISDPLKALRAVPEGPLAVLIGPEGGFSQTERNTLRSLDFVFPISLGPRIMRADTAAVAALALVQAALGDWKEA